MEPFLGEIRLVAFERVPHGWARCDGQLLPINQNQALFALLGTTYGGNGQTHFALPDLRGRVPLHAGAGAGLSDRPLGTRAGAERVALQEGELPPHTHAPTASAAAGTTRSPGGMAPARGGHYGHPDGARLAPTRPAGQGDRHENMPPFLALTFVIALQGVFPPTG